MSVRGRITQHPTASATASSTTSSSKDLLRLIQQLLPPGSSDSLVSSHFASALQLLSNSNATSSASTVQSTEFSIAEKIKKRLARAGRESDALTFQALYLRLQKSTVLKNRESVLNLLLCLSEPPQTNAKPRQKFKKVAPFLVQSTPITNGGPVDQGTASNGLATTSASGSSFLSSIHSARPQQGGYHPPIPPKPNLQVKPRLTGDDKLLLRELIYIFQGIEGVIVKRGRDGKYVMINDSRKQFSPPVLHICYRLAELGWLYHQVNGYCLSKAEKVEEGLTVQSFVTALKNELTEFYHLLSTIEAQLQETDSSLSLLQLSVWVLDPLNRMKLLVSVVEACQDLRGGALLSAVFTFLRHGDKQMSGTVQTLLSTAAKPTYIMLLRWICDGVLEDPYHEFFIATDPKVQGDHLWHEKYSIRMPMIPKFLTMNWVKKIFATGKSINFLHEVCHENSQISGKGVFETSLDKTPPENLFSTEPSEDNVLHQKIHRAFMDTSSHVLSVLFTRYKFLDHITAIRKYLLLGQGDFIRYLLQLLEDCLRQPATSLYPHNLAGILETAIRATNAQYEDEDILDRLDVRLMEIQPGDTGWDVFSLDYKVAGPIGTVFRPSVMNQYLMLFNTLWRAKRMEWILSCVWKQQKILHKMCKTVPELKPLLHIANLLTSEMIHFIHQLAFYITFEVMECSWDILMKQLRKADSLDEVIEAHDEFLHTLVRKSLLDERSFELLTQLRAIYDRIIEFQGIQQQLYTSAVGEAESRAAEQLNSRRRQRHRDPPIDEQGKLRERKKTFNDIILTNLKAQLKIVSQSYQDMVRTFLLQLSHTHDQTLQFRGFNYRL